MKNAYRYLSAAILLILLLSGISYSQWIKMVVVNNSYPNKGLTSNTNYIFAANSTSGVYRSSNFGVNWSRCNSGLNDSAVTVLSSRNDTILLGGGGSQGPAFYFSANSGNNWIKRGLLEMNETFIYPDTNDIYVTNQNGVYKTTNMGINWTTFQSLPDVNTFAKSTDILYAGTTILGMGYSTNGGLIWYGTYNYSAGYNIKSILYYNNLIYGSIYGRGFASFNQSTLYWTLLNNGLTNQYTNYIFRTGNYMFACTQGGGLYRAKIGEWNWTTVNEGITSPNIYTITEKSPYIFIACDSGIVYKRLKSEIVSVNNITTVVPEKYSLEQNYPNPFNPSTKIRFSIPENGKLKTENGIVTLKVYDVLGKEVATLMNEALQPGTYEVPFSILQFSIITSGIYFYQLSVDGERFAAKKMMVLK